MTDTPAPASSEALVLHAVLDGDDEAARSLLRRFLPGELAELNRAAVTISRLCGEVRSEADRLVHWGGPHGDTRHMGHREACTESGCGLHYPGNGR